MGGHRGTSAFVKIEGDWYNFGNNPSLPGTCVGGFACAVGTQTRRLIDLQRMRRGKSKRPHVIAPHGDVGRIGSGQESGRARGETKGGAELELS
jgi:hypothetical protein